MACSIYSSDIKTHLSAAINLNGDTSVCTVPLVDGAKAVYINLVLQASDIQIYFISQKLKPLWDAAIIAKLIFCRLM